ncbi:MAG TPA: hypothetical protein PK992_08620, partial [Planctomycetaceae bacterium]|nr:hypothetical protein [Planctomycetaceae bacterium]
MTGCERQPAATVSPNYDSASDRYATSDLNGPSASAVPAPDMEPDVAAASAPGDGSGTAAPESSDPADSPPSNTPESRGAVNASSDITNSDERSNSPMAARIAELEEIVADLQAQLDDSRHRRGPADTNQGATRQANATRVAAPAPAMPEPDVARVQATPARNGITASGNRYARLDLDRLIRRYKRARVEVAKSQASYEIDHLMAMIKAGEFLV